MAEQCVLGSVRIFFSTHFVFLVVAWPEILIVLYVPFVCVCVHRSKIQGLGLYAARDLEKHTMVIEYIGEVIRSELSELREKQYEAKVCTTIFFPSTLLLNIISIKSLI